MTHDERAFWATIKAALTDTLPQVVFADWLDERGRTDLAFAMRWAAARRRYPMVTPAKGLASWSTLLKGQHRPPYSDQLPRLVFEKLRDGVIYSHHRQYANVPRAFFVLADALAAIRAVIDPDGKGVK